MALRNKLQKNGYKNTCYGSTNNIQSSSSAPTERSLTYQGETISGVVYDVQEKQDLRFTFISPASPVADFGTTAPLLSAAAQNYSTPKPVLPLEGLSASSPWVEARAGGWAAVTDRPK